MWPWTGLPTSLFFCLLPVQGNTVVSTLEDCHENQINKDLMVLAVFSAWPRSLKKLSRQLEPPDLLLPWKVLNFVAVLFQNVS